MPQCGWCQSGQIMSATALLQQISSPTDEDINEALKDADDPEAALKSWQESGHMADLRQAVRRAKATQWLMDTAHVTEVEED